MSASSLGDFTPVLLTRDPGDGPESLPAYRDAGGYVALARALAELSPEEVCALVTDAELVGRGGAGFPTGRKWELARRAARTPKYVVANGGEHEPGSRKDQVLLATHPHRVIEGLALAAYATGASTGYLYVIEDMAPAIDACQQALGEAYEVDLLGPGNAQLPLDIELVLAPTTYVAGEETAALEVIEGKESLPRAKPPYPGETGLHGKPTTVNNVETLAHVPGIVKHGAGWFKDLGAPGSAGTMLFTLPDAVRNPGVYELPFGASFRDLVYGRGGGLRSGGEVRALLPALSCGFLTADALDAPIDRAAMKERGTSLGCGGVSLVEAGQCVACRAAEIAAFFMAAQCGQCPPCRMETNTLSAILKRLTGGEEVGDYQAQVGKIAAFTRGKGKCSLIEMAAAPIESALRLFPEDFAHHAERGTCPAAG